MGASRVNGTDSLRLHDVFDRAIENQLALVQNYNAARNFADEVEVKPRAIGNLRRRKSLQAR